jgi:hypothetical protein
MNEQLVQVNQGLESWRGQAPPLHFSKESAGFDMSSSRRQFLRFGNCALKTISSGVLISGNNRHAYAR